MLKPLRKRLMRKVNLGPEIGRRSSCSESFSSCDTGELKIASMDGSVEGRSNPRASRISVNKRWSSLRALWHVRSD